MKELQRDNESMLKFTKHGCSTSLARVQLVLASVCHILPLHLPLLADACYRYLAHGTSGSNLLQQAIVCERWRWSATSSSSLVVTSVGTSCFLLACRPKSVSTYA